jgi:AraC-like DNA-binding protein
MTLAWNPAQHAALLTACRRYADAHADRSGAAATPVSGLSIVRALHPGELQVAVQKPLIAMLLQGRKRVTTSRESFEYVAGQAMVIAADVPTTSEVTEASPAAPYYALVLEFDPAILRDLSTARGGGRDDHQSIGVQPIDADVTDAAYRLARLFDEPEVLAALGPGLLRELHFWLLRSPHGPALRALAAVDSHAARIGRAVDILRRGFARTIRVAELADAAGMSEPTFHLHFRAVTTLSPLQFQKQLRLIEARRLMLAEGLPIAQAAFSVGYASVPQFTRDYGRLFHAPPGRDMRQARRAG